MTDALMVDRETAMASLAALGRVWGAVSLLHPWVASREIDWDGAVP